MNESQDFTELKTTIATIAADLKNLIDRLKDYVPQHCVAHAGRLDTMEKQIESLEKTKANDSEFQDLKANITWLWRTAGGAVISSLILTGILVIKYFG